MGNPPVFFFRYEGFHEAARAESAQDGAHAGDPQILEELDGFTVDSGFFRIPFLFRGIEALEKARKTHHVDEFMGHNVSGQREQRQVGVPAESSSDDVVLQANLEIVAVTAGQGLVPGGEGITADLGEGMVGDFLRMEVLEGLDVVAIPLPLGCGDFVPIADEFLGDAGGFRQDEDFFRIEGNPFPKRPPLVLHRLSPVAERLRRSKTGEIYRRSGGKTKPFLS